MRHTTNTIEISIVIPTYNEAENVPVLVRRIHNSLKSNYKIIIVDDNSPDNTAKIANELGKKYSIKVVNRKGEPDLSQAVMDGFKAAKSKYVCVMDADLSHPPELITDFLELIKDEKVDIVVGSRLIEGGGVENWPFHRKLISKIATLWARPLTKVKDPMSGFFLFKKQMIKNVKLTPKGYKILFEMLVKSNCKNFVEIPYTFRDRVAGKTKLGSKVIFNFIEHAFVLYLFKSKSIIPNMTFYLKNMIYFKFFTANVKDKKGIPSN